MPNPINSVSGRLLLAILFYREYTIQIQNMDVEDDPMEQNSGGTTIVRLWRRNHHIFKGKFSSGATPKTHKDSAVKLNHTDKKGKLTFTNDNVTPRRRLNICNILKQDMEPTICKKISKIEEVEE